MKHDPKRYRTDGKQKAMPRILEIDRDAAKEYARLILGEGLTVRAAAIAAKERGLVRWPLSESSLADSVRAGLVPGVGAEAVGYKRVPILARDRNAAKVYADLVGAQGLSVSEACRRARTQGLVSSPVTTRTLATAIRKGFLPGVGVEAIERHANRDPMGGGIAAMHVGKRFGKLTVTKFDAAVRNASGHPVAECRCDCGSHDPVLVDIYRLLGGAKTSCGRCGAMGRRGMSKSPLYSSWRSMLYRCENPRCSDFRHYGARGVSVCEDWHWFDTYEEWMYSQGWEPGCGLTMDRIDPDGDYCPANVRLVPKGCQGIHRTTNRTVHDGSRSIPVWQLAERTGIPARVIIHRLDSGWPLLEAITTPVGSVSSLEQIEGAKRLLP